MLNKQKFEYQMDNPYLTHYQSKSIFITILFLKLNRENDSFIQYSQCFILTMDSVSNKQ